LSPQKILWIHYDEKWFYSWVSRQAANICELLGLEKTHTYLYDMCHIDKVMAVAFTAFAFDESIEDGGRGVKLGFYRVQEARAARKLVKKNRRDENGRYDGGIIRDEGDTYLIDGNVAGSDEWTWDKPKFCLSTLFQNHIFPKVLDLVSEGGEFEGYLPVFQGDNAGAHIDASNHNYFAEYCAWQGWRWEPQAPQMPHINSLALAVFPEMSKEHSSLLRKNSNRMPTTEEIWSTIESVWSNMDSASIARGFILAYRIAQKVIDNGGTNTFLPTQDFHAGVREDFLTTSDGVQKKVRVI
jgi:hypothetical protein